MYTFNTAKFDIEVDYNRCKVIVKVNDTKVNEYDCHYLESFNIDYLKEMAWCEYINTKECQDGILAESYNDNTNIEDAVFELGFQGGILWVTVDGEDINMGDAEGYVRVDIEDIKEEAWYRHTKSNN